jgi:hypothetical protein
VYGDATRALATSRKVSEPVKADFRAIFNDPAYAQQLNAAQLSLGGVINNVRKNAGDPLTVVKKLMSGSRSCIFFEATTDLSSVLVHPTPVPSSEYYQLGPKAKGNDPNHLNSTPWAVTYNVAFLTPTSVPNRCDAG